MGVTVRKIGSRHAVYRVATECGAAIVVKCVPDASKELQFYAEFAVKHCCEWWGDTLVRDSGVLMFDASESLDLFDYCNMFAPFDAAKWTLSADSQTIIGQLVMGVAHLHSLSTYHRDIKLENVVVRIGERVRIRIIDWEFFWSAPLHQYPGQRAASDILTTGSLYNIGPEIRCPEAHNWAMYLKMYDVWATLCVIYCITLRQYPFNCANRKLSHTVLPFDPSRFAKGNDGIVTDKLLTCFRLHPNKWRMRYIEKYEEDRASVELISKLFYAFDAILSEEYTCRIVTEDVLRAFANAADPSPNKRRKLEPSVLHEA